MAYRILPETEENETVECDNLSSWDHFLKGKVTSFKVHHIKRYVVFQVI